jgi:hypothetical protein
MKILGIKFIIVEDRPKIHFILKVTHKALRASQEINHHDEDSQEEEGKGDLESDPSASG